MESGCGRKSLCPVLRSYHCIYWKDWGK